METAASDIKYMKRCIELARKGKGKTGLNPLVGSVIVYKDRIIGEGYHEKYGGPHAEVNAISSVKNKALLKDSTIYVNLEPCSHYGKTPPCSLLIQEMNIPRVVVGVQDPNPKVAGKGINSLEMSGVEVITGVLEKESKQLNRRFFTNILKNRPYIILKWAESRDGYIDKIRKKNSPAEPTWITSSTARKLVHKWRGEEDAIFAGLNTVIMDNPSLSLRDWSGKQPIRVSLDKHDKISSKSRIKDGTQETIIFRTGNKPNSHFFSHQIQDDLELDEMMNSLYDKQIGSIIVEGGAKIINSLINIGLWDEARVFIGNVSFGSGIQSPRLSIPPDERLNYGDSILLIRYK